MAEKNADIVYTAWMLAASGIQSPLSFGGFGSLTRHIHRLTDAFSEALQSDSLSKRELGLINAYQPSLSATWMFQVSTTAIYILSFSKKAP